MNTVQMVRFDITTENISLNHEENREHVGLGASMERAGFNSL